jgi:hypothetical protein
MAEYGFMVQTMEIKPDMEDATADGLGQMMAMGFGQMAQKAAKGLTTLQGGNWEIMSHDVTRLGRHLIVSFLLRRQAKTLPQS